MGSFGLCTKIGSVVKKMFNTRYVFSEQDIQCMQKNYSQYIQRENACFAELITECRTRIQQIAEWQRAGAVTVLGGIHREGRGREVLCIFRYPDGTQQDKRYSFSSIVDARKFVKELQEQYRHYDWTQWEGEVK